MPRNLARLALSIALLVLTCTTASARQPAISLASAAALESWATAVRAHTPGQFDEHVKRVWSLTLADRKELDAGLKHFIAALTGRRVNSSSPAERSIAKLGGDLALDPGAPLFLKRAAVLHGDAAISGYRGPVILPVPVDAPRLQARPRDVSALLFEREGWIENDGQVVAMTRFDWNWGFARSLLGWLDAPAADPFVGEWYHATAAFMFKHRIFGEVAWHLDVAAIVAPNDARILLDRGCYEERQGLPRSQATLSDRGAGRPTGLNVLIGPEPADLGILPVATSNGAAERFFRQAIARDPRLFEARIRLARLLTLRKRYADALAVIAAAPPGTPPDTSAAFFGHLFAARAEAGLGRLTEAAERIGQARGLVPDAQSALMAASHIATLRMDSAGAEEPMRHLATLPADRGQSADPWWVYDIFTGRYAESLLAQMWTSAAAMKR